ncbi:N-6 DNA methylase [Candidatus Poribacteria bacterium]|nr:N-6 DNA methylase [Candidatus Poribacteria bacterium]
MDTNKLLSTLNYSDSPCFLRDSHLYVHPGYAHIFRRAMEKCCLRGVYTLRQQSSGNTATASIVPIIYVCEAESEEKAREIHRLVWNQNVAPFVLVSSPKAFRLYSGFKYYAGLDGRSDQAIRNVEKSTSIVKTTNSVLEAFAELKAENIDNGKIWAKFSKELTAEHRIDWSLLENLKKLSAWLLNHHLPRKIAHSLIGRYVYLRYLKDREILSDRKFEQWRIEEGSVFGPNATVEGFYSISERLKQWLNGEVFPLSSQERATVEAKHIQKVASAFRGDDPDSDQMHLDFAAYDFAHIPIETFSIVYQQFLHAEGAGRKSGAYYTPLHLVNFMLDEMDAGHPLRKGMKVFDPACGSGAFLVQSYRRLVERELASKSEGWLQPANLRQLLVEHVYGMEIDEDACGITELSLILTLLDYVRPPDLEAPQHRGFKLPLLRNRNIFHSPEGFFKPIPEWNGAKPKEGFDWIVGNPPWRQLKKGRGRTLEKADKAALDWIAANKTNLPTGLCQVAEAFAWEVTKYLSTQGKVGLLMPAATLIKKTSEHFRCKFFNRMSVWCVVNFANLRHLLFKDAESPAAAFFYSLRSRDECDDGNTIITYSPFAIDQVNCFERAHANKEMWTIIVNSSEVKEVRVEAAATGSRIPWKLAMWGSARDRHLLESLEARFPTLSEFAKEHSLTISEGPQLRQMNSSQEVDPIQVTGKNRLVLKNIRGRGRIFSFPPKALEPIDKSLAYVRRGRGKVTFKICEPPHIIADAARRFAVFSNDFVVVPPRQIGIASAQSETNLLKALSLYLSSDFVRYHQFLTTIFGVERDQPTIDDLKRLPVPLNKMSDADMIRWTKLQEDLARTCEAANSQSLEAFPLERTKKKDAIRPLLNQLNQAVYALLGLNEPERLLVHDLVEVRTKLNEGRVAREAVRPASEMEMGDYAETFKEELDTFLDEARRLQHHITVFFGETDAMIQVLHPKKSSTQPVKVLRMGKNDTSGLAKIRERLLMPHGQWIYFQRNLRVYDSHATYIFKPRHRLYWLKSQALIDADEFLADMLAASDEDV